MKFVLLTGGAGFIGSHITNALLADGYDVDIVDNLSTGRRENLPAAASFLELDLRHSGTIKHLPRPAGYLSPRATGGLRISKDFTAQFWCETARGATRIAKIELLDSCEMRSDKEQPSTKVVTQ